MATKPVKINEVAVEKHLVEIKELPPEEERVEQVQKREPKAAEKMETEAPMVLDDKEEMVINKREFIFSAKDVILNIVNLISIILLITILIRFPEKSKELKALRIEDLKNESNAVFEFGEIDASREKSKDLQKLFIDDSGIVDFVNEVEKLKTEGSAISKVSFATPKALKDKTGNLGLPVVIEFRGSWEAIDRDLQKIDKLSFLTRPVKIEILKPKLDSAATESTNSNVVEFKYGLILYVNDQFGESR